MPQRVSVARQLEQCASDLHSVAFDFDQPARCIAYAERRIARVEEICARIRSAVRGR